MKGIKRGTRRPSGTPTDASGESDNAGFNAKTLKNASNYDSAGERKMRLNNKPIFSPTGTKPKLPNLSLRASLNRIRTLDPGDQHDLSRNLMDDQSVASFGITDSRKLEVLTDVELARSSNQLTPAEDSHKQLPPRRSSAHAYTVGTSSASFGDAASQDHVPRRYGGKASTEKLHNSWSESAAGTTIEPIDMFDNFTQQRRSSTSNSGEPDPFESVDVFASHGADVSNFKPPAVQRASQIDEEPSIDESNKSESAMKDSSGGDHGKIKKSKMQKIGELLAERKKWSLERRILRAKTMSQAEKIARLEKEVQELGASEARAEEMNKLTRDLDKSQKEAKLAKKQLLRKKSELMAKDKELVDNVAEISTLRKELSKALQQVDMLEEELENDKTRILTLTKGLLGADSGTDDYSTDYVETRQEQQEIFERELNKKDLKIESQRLEVNKQAEQILLLKSELALAQTLGRKNEVLAEQIADLTEANEAITAELGLKEQELTDARKKQAAQNTVHAAKLRELERERRTSARDLLASSRTISRDDESVAALRKDLNATKTALAESQQKITTITSQNVESISRLQDTIHHLETEKIELQSKLQQGDPSLQASINHLQHTNQDLERTVQDLERNLDRERKEFEKLESKLNSQISNLRSSLEASQHLHQQSENEAKMGVSGLQAKLSETEMALEEMKLYNEELEASVEELKETSADVEQDFSRLQDEHLDLQAKAAELEVELERARKSSVDVQGRLAETQEQGVALDEKNQRLERELTQLADENGRLKGTVEDAEAHAAEAQQAVSALEDLMDEYDDLQDEAHTLREKVSALELELVKVKMESREWRASAGRAEKDISDARESLALASGAQSEVELLKKEANKFFQDFIQVQKKLEEGNTERDALRKQLRDASFQLEEHGAIVTELEHEQSRLHGIEEEAKRLREFKQSAELQINELTCERDKWRESATAALAGLAAKEAEISDLTNANSEYSVFRTKAAELRTEVDARQSELEVIRKERDDFRVAAELADAELAKARTSLASLDDLMEDYELLQTEADTLHQDKTQLELELKALLKQTCEVEETSRLEAAKAEVAFAELEALRSQVESHDRDTSELAHTNANLVVKVAELHSSLDDWKRKGAQAEANAIDASELSERCVEYQKRIESMESIMSGLHEDYGQAMLKMQNLEVENANWKSNYEMTASELNETYGTSQSLEKQYHEDLTTLRSEHSMLLTEIEERNKQDLHAQSEAGELRILRNQLRAEIDALNAQKAELQSTSDASNIVAVEANASIPSSRSVGGKIEWELKHLQAENARLAARVDEMNEERNQLVEKNMEVQMQLADRDSTRASLDEAKRARSSLQADLESLRERYALMDQKIESITSDRDHWQQMAEASENQAGEANDALIALEEQMEQSRRIEREQMNGEMKALQSQIDELVSERNQLKESLAKADISITNAVRESSTLRLSLSELNAAKDKIGVLESENADLVAKMIASSKERETLMASAALAESKSVDAHAELISLKKEREELMVTKLDAKRTREQNSQFLLEITELQAAHALLKAGANRAEVAEMELNHTRRALLESEQRIAHLEKQYADLQLQIEDLHEEHESLISASDATKQELKEVQASFVALQALELDLKGSNADLHSESAAIRTQHVSLQKEMAVLLNERDQLNESVLLTNKKSEQLSTRLSTLEESEKTLVDLRKQIDEVRHRLNVSDEESVVTAIKLLQQDYSDVLDENDRLRESLADLDGEIVELHAEKEELLTQAEQRAGGAFSVASQSSHDATGMQELCEELQRQLQAMTRDRDSWKETADTVARTGNKGERRRTTADSDDCSVSSARSIGSEQHMLLRQAMEYRDKRDGKKSSWGFSTFAVQRPTKVDTESTADSSVREELIDRLTELNETYLETIAKLKSEVVGLNTSLKEESYSMKKKLNALEQENQAYELKIMALEHELDRIGSETKSSDGPGASGRSESLELVLDQLQSEKETAERQVSLLKSQMEKLNSASARDAHHKQVEIDHLKTIQDDMQAKVNALENMMDAIYQENETLRRIAEKATNFSLESDLGKQYEQDYKDVQIARLHHELAELQLQGHQKLKNQVLQLQSEKHEMQSAMEEHYLVMDEENRSHLEDLEMRLKARDETIKQLRGVLETVADGADDASFDSSGDSTYLSAGPGR